MLESKFLNQNKTIITAVSYLLLYDLIHRYLSLDLNQPSPAILITTNSIGILQP